MPCYKTGTSRRHEARLEKERKAAARKASRVQDKRR